MLISLVGQGRYHQDGRHVVQTVQGVCVVAEAFKAQQQELMGDVLLNSGELAKAKTAYQAAVAATKDAQNPILKVKLDELAHVTAA